MPYKSKKKDIFILFFNFSSKKFGRTKQSHYLCTRNLAMSCKKNNASIAQLVRAPDC